MTSRRIFVTEPGYDDIGSLMGSMGEGYRFTPLPWSERALAELSPNDILFINCHASCVAHAGEWRQRLRSFVSSGGTLYCSDWAGAFLEEAFSDYLSFRKDGQQRQIEAKVVDPGLREILGNSIALEFDLAGWWVVTKTGKSVKVHLTDLDLPLLASFKCEAGHVLYTSFHNKAQTSSVERKLLEYLVFRPLLSRAADQAAEHAAKRRIKISKEVFASAKEGQGGGSRFALEVDRPATILCILSWDGSARFRLALMNPQGAVEKEVVSGSSPLGIEFFAPNTGEWSVVIQPLSLPFESFPFVVSLGTGGDKKTLTGRADSTEPAPQPGVGEGNDLWNPDEEDQSQPDASSAANPVVAMRKIALPGQVNDLPTPSLIPIQNMGGFPDYVIRWLGQAGVDGFILEEADSFSFADAKEIFRGREVMFECKARPIGTYFYRVASFQGNLVGQWSSPQSVSVTRP
jgi:hypothetical protein